MKHEIPESQSVPRKPHVESDRRGTAKSTPYAEQRSILIIQEEDLETSLALLEQAGAEPSASIIDAGGGEPTLVDDLLAHGYSNITVLDIS